MQTVSDLNKIKSLKFCMENKTFEYKKRRDELKLKKKLMKEIILCNLSTTKKCMSCFDEPTFKYPLYLCSYCFNILYSPKKYTFTPFDYFYRKYSSTSCISELKKLAKSLESYSDEMYKNLHLAIIRKIKGHLDVSIIRQKLMLIREQISYYNQIYFETDVRNGLDSLITVKKLIITLENEAESLEQRINNKFL